MESNETLVEQLHGLQTSVAVLIAGRTSLDQNLKESFARLHHRIDGLEVEHNKGCPLMAKSIEETKNDLQTLEATLETIGTIGKWVGGILIGYSISFGTYVLSELQDLDNRSLRERIERVSAVERIDNTLVRITSKGE
jgi:chaperonin cofactor prefoldin